jgi:hypothetical protein
MSSIFPKDFTLRDGVLRIVCLAHPEVTKSDGFIFALDGHYILHDGGMTKTTFALDALLALREAAGVDVLHFDWLISHYHIDHVCGPIENVICDPRFAIDTVVLPPHNALPEDMPHGDTKYSPRIEAAIREFHPNCRRIEVHYHSENPSTILYNFEGAEIEILPPDTDWSRPRELYEIIAKGYFDTDDIYNPKVPTSVGNTASVWYLIRYAGKKILFTGDSMKRTRTITEESVDRMWAIYKDIIGRPNIAKWPHHGQARDDADLVMHEMDPEYILTTAHFEGASVRYNKVFPENNVRFFNSSESDVLMSIASDGTIEVSGGKEGVNDGEVYVLTAGKIK